MAIPAERAVQHGTDRGKLLADHLQSVDKRSGHHDSGAVLIVMEHWNIADSFNFLSTSKQRGAEISSKIDAAKAARDQINVRTSSSTSLERMQMGNASTLANSLNRAHFPSITGIPASGPISPRPSTAVPS